MIIFIFVIGLNKYVSFNTSLNRYVYDIASNASFIFINRKWMFLVKVSKKILFIDFYTA